jgi:hypothetical protein
MITRVHRRPYRVLVSQATSNTTTIRQTILTPRTGYRTRITRIRLIQNVADGRHLWELYFGAAGNIITDPSKGIDILAVRNLGTATTRTYLQHEGPRGLRDEVLSGRWRGTAPTDAHRIIIEYEEEP